MFPGDGMSKKKSKGFLYKNVLNLALNFFFLPLVNNLILLSGYLYVLRMLSLILSFIQSVNFESWLALKISFWWLAVSEF